MSCNCGNPWHDKWCPEFLQPAQACPAGPECDEETSTDCVLYTGPDLPCFGITHGMTITQVIAILYNYIYPNCNTTTTTHNPCEICSGFAATPTIACLYGLKIEFLYIANAQDYLLLPPGYIHPCQTSIATHNCNRALHEVYLSGNYIGDARMNNDDGDCGPLSEYGTPICKDYKNTPAPLTGGIWKGSEHSRYSSITISMEEAIQIATASGGSSNIVFNLDHAVTKYGASCDNTPISHQHEIWVRITKPNGTVIYNDCELGGSFTVDVCSNTPYVTTTTTIPVTTTTTLSCATCRTYNLTNTGAAATYVTYNTCGTNQSAFISVLPSQTKTICACTGSVTYPSGSSITVTNVGACVPTTTTTTI
jgi:hypothetical protein